jgi:hypothetical protein
MLVINTASSHLSTHLSLKVKTVAKKIANRVESIRVNVCMRRNDCGIKEEVSLNGQVIQKKDCNSSEQGSNQETE